MKKIISLIAIVMLLQSCYKDEGNYDYRDINEITISGIPSTYETSDGTATIIPVFASTMPLNENDLTFEWLSLTSGQVFATTRNLENTPLGLSGSYHIVRYRVTDQSSGKMFDKEFTLYIRTTYTTGYLVMNDVDGMMRLDMLSWLNNVYTHYPEVGFGLPPQTGPKKIVNFSDPVMSSSIGGRAIYLLTQTGTNRIHPVTLSWEPNYNIRYAFLSPDMCPPDFVADNISSLSNVALLSGQGNFYLYAHTSNILWSDPINTIDLGVNYYTPSPIYAGYGQYYLVFDSVAKSFYNITVNAARTTKINTALATLTPYENTEKDIVYMGANYAFPGFTTNIFFYSILKDANSDYWLLRSHTGASQPVHTQDIWIKMNATDINRATAFAVGGEFFNNLYYAVDGKVYEYNIADNQSYLMLDKENEKITYLGFVLNTRHGTDFLDAYKCIVVASYNETAKVGTLEHYTIPPLQQPFVLYEDPVRGATHSWSGFGKIVDVCNK